MHQRARRHDAHFSVADYVSATADLGPSRRAGARPRRLCPQSGHSESDAIDPQETSAGAFLLRRDPALPCRTTLRNMRLAISITEHIAQAKIDLTLLRFVH